MPTLIRMQYRLFRRSRFLRRTFQYLAGQIESRADLNTVTDDFPVKQIHNRRKVYLFSAYIELGNVRYPFLIRLFCMETASQDIRHNFADFSFERAVFAPPYHCLQPRLRHQTADFLVIDRCSCVTDGCRNPPVAVSSLMSSINIMDMPFQIGIFVFCRLDGQLVIEGQSPTAVQRMALP